MACWPDTADGGAGEGSGALCFEATRRDVLNRRPGGLAPVPAHESYTQDSFFEAVWEWGWWHGGIRGLVSLCPRCQCELVAEKYWSEERGGYVVHLRCQHCGYIVATPGGSAGDLDARVTREIRRKVRTGEWAQVAQQQREEQQSPQRMWRARLG